MIKRKLHNWIKENLNSYSILLLLIFTIFITPLFQDDLQEILEMISSAAIFFTVIFISPKNRKIVSGFIFIVIALRFIIAPIIGNSELLNFSRALALLVFFYANFRLAIQIAQSEEVDAKVVIDAINGYLLLGLTFAQLAHLVELNFPGAYSFPDVDDSMALFNYFSFVTLSTLGYGDITPQIPISRSLSVLTALVGQMYTAILIAVIVGKYSMNHGKSRRPE